MTDDMVRRIDEEPAPADAIVERAVAVAGGILIAILAIALVVVSRSSITLTVRAPGHLARSDIVTLRAPFGATLEKLHARAGDSVVAGALLASLASEEIVRELAEQELALMQEVLAQERLTQRLQLDSLSKADAVTAARAALERARSQLRLTNLEYADRAGGRAEPGRVVSTPMMVDLAEADVAAAASRLRLAELALTRHSTDSSDLRISRLAQRRIESRLAEMRDRLEDAAVRAPVAGLVLADFPDHRIGSVLPEGQALFALATSDRWQAVLFVPADEIATVHVGDSVWIDMPSLQDARLRPLTGVVVAIGLEPTSTVAQRFGEVGSSGLGTSYRAEVKLHAVTDARVQERLRHDMPIEARILTTRRGILAHLVARVGGGFRSARGP